MGAFRTADGSETLEAPTADGTLKLEVAPRHVTLDLAPRRLVITDEFLTITETHGKKVKRWSERVGGALVVARDVPCEDIGLWMELEPNALRRVFGAPPRDLISEDGLVALRALDRLTRRLRLALAPHAHGVRRGFEMGRGLDKVLVADHGEHLVVYARRLFGGVARRVLEVHTDGTIVLPGRAGDRKVTIRDKWGVTVHGDLVRFMQPDGTDLGQVALHWIDQEDREELARRIGEMVERNREPRREDGGDPRRRRAAWQMARRLVGRMRVRQQRGGF